METSSKFDAINNRESRMALTHDQLFVKLTASRKLYFTSAAVTRLGRSPIQWLNSIWKEVESKPDSWRATVTTPNMQVGSSNIRLALEIRRICSFPQQD
jgi:hypothetical protein